MPGKNKPKRLDRNRKWRVARRKLKRNILVKGIDRNRDRNREQKSGDTVGTETGNRNPLNKETKMKPWEHKSGTEIRGHREGGDNLPNSL